MEFLLDQLKKDRKASYADIKAKADEKKLKLSVREVMVTRLRLKTVQVNTPLRELTPMLDSGFVPIVMDGDTFCGLITRMDVLNHLRRRLKPV